ncbi:serine O-succinyltransferase-like [Amphiura filiformis]|uniref:serine O-succinyltransferase-like n=1 Tax=Amphiura filiformis TaxID=82378 RepID=UPI003B21A416
MKAARVITQLLPKQFSRCTSSLTPSLINTQYAGGTTEPSTPQSHGRRKLSTSIAVSKDMKKSSDYSTAARELPQLEVPNYDRELKFKGLETDFPCLSRLPTAGPDATYQKVTTGFKEYHHKEPFSVKYNEGILPELTIAYETFGTLNEDKSNAVIIFCGLSASSHIRSHKDNPAPGWWEKFVGPGCAVDTNEFFVICCNNLAGCYGTTGPSSINPTTGQPYGTTFPIISVDDIVHSQFLLLDHFGIDKVYATVGSSLGGMTSLLSPALYPDRVGRAICISCCAQTHPTSISLRYLQRRAIMTDPNWARGHYYGESYPRMGMKLAREIATITYRSGPEWGNRFGRKRTHNNASPSLCPYFEIEEYIEYQGESFSTKFDPNSLLYISKAMDLFDMSEGYSSLLEGVSRVKCPVMIIGVQTDILIPCWQQKEIADLLKKSGNTAVTYYELDSLYGHDTFLLDLSNVGSAVKGQLETKLTQTGIVRKQKPQWLAEDAERKVSQQPAS